MLTTELNQFDKLTQTHALKLRSRFGARPNTTSILLSLAGDNAERL